MTVGPQEISSSILATQSAARIWQRPSRVMARTSTLWIDARSFGRTSVAVHRTATGPQLFLLHHRLHHGLTGCALVGIGVFLRHHRLTGLGALLVGASLAAHDRHDWKVWLKRELDVELS